MLEILSKVLPQREITLLDTFYYTAGQFVCAVGIEVRVILELFVLTRKCVCRIMHESFQGAFRPKRLDNKILLIVLRSISTTFCSIANWRMASG